MTARSSRLRSLAVACCAATLFAACGDDSEPSANDDRDTTAPTFTGEPVSIGVILPSESSGANFPETLAAVEAGARGVNERGGLNGRELVVEYCNEKNDANQAASCAREMVDKGVIATLATFSNFGKAIYDVLEPAGIPQLAVAAVTPEDFSNSVSYPIDASLLAFVGCGALFPVAADADPIAAVRFDLDTAGQGVALAQAGAASAGATLSTVSKQPVTVSDMAPAVSDVTSAGAEGVVLVLPEQQSVQLIQTAAQLGEDLAYCHSDAGVSPDALTELGEAAEGFYAVSPYPALSQRSEIAEMDRMFEELAAADEAGVADAAENQIKGGSIRAWLGVQVLEEVATGVTGDLTAASFRAALDTAQVSVDGLLDIDFSKPSNIPSGGGPLTRIFNGTVRLLKWDVDERAFAAADGTEPLDALGVLQAAGR